MPHVPIPSSQETLDLGAIPGVLDHYHRTGQVPILVFRCARQIRVVQNPFPGIWRLSSATETRNLMVGKSTFSTPFALNAGDELTLTPIMSATAPAGPRIQVPAELVNDIGELEPIEDLPEAPVDAFPEQLLIADDGSRVMEQLTQVATIAAPEPAREELALYGICMDFARFDTSTGTWEGCLLSDECFQMVGELREEQQFPYAVSQSAEPVGEGK